MFTPITDIFIKTVIIVIYLKINHFQLRLEACLLKLVIFRHADDVERSPTSRHQHLALIVHTVDSTVMLVNNLLNVECRILNGSSFISLHRIIKVAYKRNYEAPSLGAC